MGRRLTSSSDTVDTQKRKGYFWWSGERYRMSLLNVRGGVLFGVGVLEKGALIWKSKW